MSPEGTSASTSTGSGPDLMSTIPADIFTSADAQSIATETADPDVSEDIPDDAGADTIETAPDVAAEESEAVEEPESVEEEATEEESAPPVEEAKPEEDLPPGVRRGQDRSGKQGLFVEPKRWDNIYGAYKTNQQLAEMIGEPLTPQALDVRNKAYMGQELMLTDLLSGDPNAQGSVLDYFFNEAQRAQEAGEIGSDPMANFGDVVYNALRDRSPDGYSRLRMAAAKDLVSEMYDVAAKTGNRNLWLSVGHLAKSLNMPFRRADELEVAARGADPAEALRAENQALKSQLEGRHANNQAAQLDAWTQDTRQKTTSAVLEEAIKPALTEEAEAWKDYPDVFDDLVVGRLHSRVKDTINKDAGFNNRIALLTKNAKLAASAQKRAEIGEQIKQAYINRARLAVDSLKGEVMASAARLLKERSDAKHARHQAAQNQRGPKGTGASVPRSIVPKDITSRESGTYNSAQAMRDVQRLLGNM